MSRAPQRLPRDLRERLASYPVVPLRGELAAIEERHRAIVEELAAVTDGRGLPIVAGFTFDPADIAATFEHGGRLAMGRSVLALHPRLGAMIGVFDVSLAPILREADYLHRPLRLDEATSLGASWTDAVAWILELDDALRRRWALWIGLGPPTPFDADFHTFDFRSRFEGVQWMYRGRRRADAEDLASSLSLSAAGSNRWRAGEHNVLFRFGSEILLATDDDDLVDKALRCASERRWPALPEATGFELPYRDAISPPAANAAYRVALPGPPNVFGIHAERTPSGAWEWSFTQDGKVNVSRHVRERTVSRATWPAIEDASPRLRSYVGRRGIARLPAMQDVAAVRLWVAQAAPEWDVLVAIEEVLGGLELGPGAGLLNPGLLGVYAILQHREALKGLDEVVEGDEVVPSRSPWPFMHTHGMDLAIVGYLRMRCDGAVCVDRSGALFVFDHEFGSLTKEAASAKVYLERMAFLDEQFIHRDGLGRTAALAIDGVVPDELTNELEIAPVIEASDAVTRWDLGPSTLLRRELAPRASRPKTLLYTRDPAVAVALARRIRTTMPDTRMQVQGGLMPSEKSRVETFAATELADVEVREWSSFGRWGGED